MVYNIAKKYNCNLIIIWCSCENEQKIKERLKARLLKTDPQSEAKSFEIYKYVKNQADKVENYELKEDRYKIIHFDTDDEKIELINCDESEKIVSIIKQVCLYVIKQFSGK